jgi:UDP-N-acetylmuramoyl-tripeptide--D-alanyl-D-alanine ligase
MIKYYWTRYLAIYPAALLYMLQYTENKLTEYLTWFNRTVDFRHVMKRRNLELTSKIKLLRVGLWSIWFVLELIVALCVYLGFVDQTIVWGFVGLIIIILFPFLVAYGIIIPLALGHVLIQKPREKTIIEEARHIFANHKGKKIAIAGSFGKTTTKEILATVLSESLNVAATPGNMNTPLGVSRFARKLTGREDVLIVEFGEGKVGDVTELCQLSQPTMGIITGINEAHLQNFKTLDQTVATIFELKDYLGKDAKIYKNKGNDLVASQISTSDTLAYDESGVDGWKVSSAVTSLEGTSFVAKKGSKVIHAHTQLIGLYEVGVTVAAISIADSFGLSTKQIEAGLANIKPFEHRMEPRRLHGAWVIDDTYNGNSDGVKVGLALLKDTKAKRRIYVTPGLVEQGAKTEEVHNMIGKLTATSADVVVLMENSVTDFIVKGLDDAHFKGELILVSDPLEFYTNMEQFVAAGDVVLMQNDWTDNYV